MLESSKNKEGTHMRLIAIKTILILFSSFAVTVSAQTFECNCKIPKAYEPKEADIPKLVDLLDEKRYFDLMQLAFSYLKHNPNNQEVTAYLAEALYRYAEIQSGNIDPCIKSNMVYIDDAGASDPVGYEIYLISNRVGPNYWSEDIIREYGDIAICTVNCIRRTRPKFTGYFSRYLTTLICMKKHDAVLNAIVKYGESSLDTPEGVGEYYAEFTGRYLGYNEIERGLALLTKVNEQYGVSSKTLTRWNRILTRMILEDAELSKEKKDLLLTRVKSLKAKY